MWIENFKLLENLTILRPLLTEEERLFRARTYILAREVSRGCVLLTVDFMRNRQRRLSYEPSSG